MTQPPGTLRPIGDPQAEMERLAEARKDPAGRQWGIRHPSDNSVSVPAPIGNHPWGSKVEAERDMCRRLRCCAYCDCPGCDVDMSAHRLAYRDIPPWRDE